MAEPTNNSLEDLRRALAAMSEPTRFRILTLLAERPHTVGEVATAIGALQPQTTKHLQALEAAGLVRTHRLGRRRLARLDRQTLAVLGDWLHTLSVGTPDDDTLARYAEAVTTANAAAGDVAQTTVLLERTLPATRDRVWAAWTDPALLARWWAPRHFTVESCFLEAALGGRVELRLREGDGARYASSGTVTAVQPGHRLEFTLAPIDDDGTPLLDAEHVLRLTGESECRLELSIRASTGSPAGAPLLAGLEPGWTQSLAALDDLIRGRQGT
jgi:uncharacterized protein YndB with AHSA1/START domain/DNA-binding transcriptional ArsR family regulator